MGRMGLDLFFYCENVHENKKKAAFTPLFVNDSDITSLRKSHYWVNEKNFVYVFKSFTHCPECGKPVDKFEITKRNAERKKGHYEYSFFHDKSRCVLPIDYEAVYPQANVIIEELIMPKLEELFSAFPHCPYCGNICKGIENVTESGESPHLYQKIKH